MTGSDHTFVVLAHGQSPYLEECIRSLKKQTVASRILLSTSTPSDFLRSLAGKCEVPLVVNPECSGIACDWTFAYRTAATKYVTLAHQDDIYLPQYTEKCLQAAGRSGDSLIVFTDYSEFIAEGVTHLNLNLFIKKVYLTMFFAFHSGLREPAFKKWLVSLGSPISCPSVMYNKDKIGVFEFSPTLKISLDWDAWLRLAEREGEFTFVREKLMQHRIHGEAETAKGIDTRQRQIEDEQIFQRIWNGRLGKTLAKFYSGSYKSNRRG